MPYASCAVAVGVGLLVLGGEGVVCLPSFTRPVLARGAWRPAPRWWGPPVTAVAEDRVSQLLEGLEDVAGLIPAPHVGMFLLQLRGQRQDYGGLFIPEVVVNALHGWYPLTAGQAGLGDKLKGEAGGCDLAPCLDRFQAHE